VKLTDWPADGLEGTKLKSVVRGCPATITVAVWLANMLLPSFTVAATESVPLTGKVVVKLVPDPAEGLPLAADQVNE